MIRMTDNVSSTIAWTDKMSGQFAFAAAMALTNTARTVAAQMPTQVAKDLDNPTPFTRRAFVWEKATKQRLVAAIVVKPEQAKYLRYQVYGGERMATHKAIKLPGEVALDQHGNIPRNVLRRLIAQAKRERAAATGKKRPGKKANSASVKGLFYGQPRNRPGMPAGVYQRVEVSDGARYLRPLVLFDKDPVHYSVAFTFHAHASRLALVAFGPAFASAVTRAKASAK